MDLKFKDFAKLIFLAEGEGILERFSQDPNLKGMYIEWLETTELEEKEGFIAAKIEAAKAWADNIEMTIQNLEGDK